MFAAIKSVLKVGLYIPLFNLLVVLYAYVTFHDLGLAIILLTIIIRLILYPLFYKSFKHQALMQKIQPEIKRIQRDHKGDKEKQALEMMKLYKEHKINPFTGLILIFIQLPILIVLYRLFLRGFTPDTLSQLYSFVPRPEIINHLFLGLIDITKPSVLIVLLAAVAQYFQAKLALPKRTANPGAEGGAEKVGRQMVFLGPVLTFVILRSLSAAIGLYWLTTSIFSVFQQYLIKKSIAKISPTTAVKELEAEFETKTDGNPNGKN